LTFGRSILLGTEGGTVSTSGFLDTFNGEISGPGALTTTGHVVLNANNSYGGGTILDRAPTETTSDISILADANLGATSGGLTFNGGTLQFRGNFDLAPSRAITLTPAGGTIELNVFNTTISQAITGDGPLTVGNIILNDAGTGRLVLTADNEYTGVTTINFGRTLQLGDGHTTGSVTGDIVDNSALVIDRSNTVTLGGLISGTGSLSQIGTGTVILTGNNTYSGLTSISAGVLQLGDGHTTGSVTGFIADDTELAIDRSNTVTLSGVIRGVGSLFQIGTGTTILIATNLYSGGTHLDAGILSIDRDANLGLPTGSLTFNGGTLLTTGAVSSNRAVILEAGGGAVNTNVFTDTLSGVISGPGGLTKLGPGTLVLTTDNTYAGGTHLDGGILSIDRDANLGAPTGSLTFNGGTLLTTGAVSSNRAVTLEAGGGTIDTSAFTDTLSGMISGSGGLAKLGPGTLVLTADNTYTGGTTISEGVLQLGANNGTTGSVVGDIIDNSELVIDRSNTVTLDGVISGAGSLLQMGTGATILTGDDTYSGGTTIAAGTLQLGNGGTSGSVTGDIVDNGALVFDRSDTVTYGGRVSGGGSLTQAGTGTLVLTGTNTYTGGTHLDGGILSIGSDANLGAPTGGLTFNGGILSIGGPVNINRAVTLEAGGGAVNTNGFTDILSGMISGPGGLTKLGPGTLVLTADNTYAGGTHLDGGILSIGSDANLGAPTGGLTFNGGTLSIGGPVNINRAVTLEAGGGAVNTNGFTDTLSGMISGNGGLTKLGPGTLVLTADDTYTGGTTISAGVLQLGNGGTSGSVTGDIVDNSALEIDRSNTVTLSGLISGTGSLSQIGTGTTILTGDNTYSGGTTIAAGTLQLGNGGTSGSVTGNIVDNGALVFDRSDTATYGGTVSGSGSLTQAGTGTLVLTADNTYTGGTTIAAGVLQLGNGGTSGSVGGDITDNGTLVFNRSDRVTYGGIVSGSGRLTVTGGTLIEGRMFGSLALTGINTYGGGTTVTPNSTLIVSTDSNLGAATAPLTLQGSGNDVSAQFSRLLIIGNGFSSGRPISLSILPGSSSGGGIVAVGNDANPGISATLSGVISGNGSLIVEGPTSSSNPATLTLTGNNTYLGGTEVDFLGTVLSISSDANLGNPIHGLGLFQGGALEITRSSSLTSNRLVEIDTGTLIIDSGQVVTIAWPITSIPPSCSPNCSPQLSADSLTVTGGGTLVLTGINTYKGDTIVTGNTTLSVSSDSNLGSGSTIHADGSTTPSTLTLDAGTLLTTANFTSARPILLGSDGDGTINTGGFTDTLTGVISGTGSLTVTGGGTLTLAGVNTYTGPTTVNGATLVVGTDSSGQLGPGMVTVNQGGTLRGVGTILGSVTNNGGTVAPGVVAGNIGTLSIGGRYSQTAAGTFAAEVNPGSASRLAVTGPANLAGTLGLIFDPGSYHVQSYTLLSASARMGTFGAMTTSGSLPPLLTPLIAYGGGEVDLQLILQPSSLPAAAATPNQLAVAQALVLALPTATGDMATVFADLVALPTLAQVQSAFEAMTGVVYTTVPTVALDNAETVMQLVFRQLDNAELLARAAGASTPVAAGPWVSLLGDTDTYQGDSNAPGFSSQTYGGLLGYDVPLNPGMSVGGLLGTWHKIVSLSDGSGASASLTSVLLGLYGGYSAGPWIAHAVIGYTFDNDTGTRPLTFASRTATSSFNPNEFLGAVEGGYRFQAGSATVTPAVGLQYAHFNQPAFTEQGANALNLSINGGSTDSLQGLFGVRAAYVSASEGHPVKVTGYAVYSHEFENTSRLINVQLQGAPNAPFTIAGVSPARDGVRLGMSVGAMLSDRFEVSGGYDVLWSSNQTFQTYNLNFKYHF
jgi:autotransporter-associated beta strand protein